MGGGTGTGGADDRFVAREGRWLTGLTHSRFGRHGSASRASPASPSSESPTVSADVRTDRPVERRVSTRKYRAGDVLKLTALCLLALLTISACLLIAWWSLILIFLVCLTIFLPRLLFRPGVATTSGISQTQTRGSVTPRDGDHTSTYDLSAVLWLPQGADIKAVHSTIIEEGNYGRSHPPFLTVSKSASKGSDENKSRRSPTTLKRSFDL